MATGILSNLASDSSFPSLQEADLLARSVKKIKSNTTIRPNGEGSEITMTESHESSAMATQSAEQSPTAVELDIMDIPPALSFADLLRKEDNDPTIIEFSTQSDYLDEDSDVEEASEENIPTVLLSKADKKRIRIPWVNSIIIKAAFAESVGYSFIYPRIKAQWKPKGKWECIDLGLDFFLVRFQDENDLHKVVYGGPWFVGPYYLTIRRWEPNFNPSKATFSTTVIWARLPELPTEFYDPETLIRIGNKIGNLLRVDAHTIHHTRGQYARLCVQVDINKPLITHVRIGKHKQRVVYEGIQTLCFKCGKIGHKESQCPGNSMSSKHLNVGQELLRPINSSNMDPPRDSVLTINAPPSTSTTNPQPEVQPYGPWIVVERRKKKPGPKGRNNSTQNGVKQKELPATTLQPETGKMVSNSDPTDDPIRQIKPKGKERQPSNQPAAPNGPKSITINAAHSLFSQPTASMSSLKIQTKNGPSNPARPTSKSGPKGQVYRPIYPTTKPVDPKGLNTQEEPAYPKPIPSFSKPQMAQIQDTQLPQDPEPSLALSIPIPFTTQVNTSSLHPPQTSIVNISLHDGGFPINPPSPNEQQSRSLSGERGPSDSVGKCSTTNNPNPIPPTTVLDHGPHLLNLALTSPGAEGDQPTEIPSPLPITGIRSQRKDRPPLGAGSKLQLRRRQHRQITHPYLPSESILSIQQASSEHLGGNRGDEGDALVYSEPMVLSHSSSPSPILCQMEALSALGSTFINSWNMKIVSWNCRGAANQNFLNHVLELKRIHSPAIMLIMETKLNGERAHTLASRIFPDCHVVDSDGLAGGLWLLWDVNKVNIDIVFSSSQAIHAVVKVCNHSVISNSDWFFSGVYGRPHFDIRSLLWHELSDMAKHVNIPWIIAGDFNDVTEQGEKFGGNPINQLRVNAYLSCMSDCGMMDMGYVGGKYTWVNMRNSRIIRERLDRFWCNSNCRILFPEATVYHLPRLISDHNPILLNLTPHIPSIGKRPFRYEKFWFDHPDFIDIVDRIWSHPHSNTSSCLASTMTSIKLWSRDTFGNLFKRKKVILARLEGIHKSLSINHNNFLFDLEKDLSHEYSEILNCEADLWFLKSRSDWIVDGDKNSRFFHITTMRHRSRNRILGLYNPEGVWITDSMHLKFMVTNYFSTLFSSTAPHSFHDSYDLIRTTTPYSLDISDDLAMPPSLFEIRKAVFSMKAFKAPGPDGTHPFFYQKLWHSVKDTILLDIQQIFISGIVPPKWNECLITLIPKVGSPVNINQFRPIGLCNVNYKIVSKIIVHRLKPLLDSIISPCQTSFVPGRRGSDNILILQELVYSYNRKTGRKGGMIIKLDLEKAYDKLEWSFIRETLIFFQLPPTLISLIMSCVSSTSMSILVNGETTDRFLPSRGIRQGDPLSPYLFILCMEFLSLRFTDGINSGLWKGCKAGRSGPTLSHLFFADDLIFIGEASQQNCMFFSSVMQEFCARSGLMINHEKSKVLFSKNVQAQTRDNLSSLLGLPQTSSLGKYLGIPITAKKIKQADCNFILDKVRSKLAGWKAKFFTMAGRTTLIKSVLAAIPNYYMQSQMLPSSTLKDLDKISRNFLWGSTENQPKMHLVSWEKITQPKSYGGLGIKAAKEANLAAMCKLNWRLHTEKHALWNRVLSTKYHINNCRFQYPNLCSPVLHNFKKGSMLFSEGLKWIPRDGNLISFWNDTWFGHRPLSSILNGPLLETDPSLLVSDCVSQGQIIDRAISYDLPPYIVQAIKAIPLSLFDSGADQFAWKLNANGSFSSSSAYCLAKKTSLSLEQNWSWIWKVHTLPKIQNFIWLLCHNRIKTLGYLNSIGVINFSTCPLCSLNSETAAHLVRNCPSSRAIWDDLLPGLTSHRTMDAPLVEWLRFNCGRKDSSPFLSIPWGTLFSFTIWTIWIQRNCKLYKPENYNPSSSISIIKNKAAEFWACCSSHQHTSQATSIAVKWTKPSSGVVKLNTDGSFLSRSGMAASGGLFRDHEGKWMLGYARNIGHTSCLAAELWAIRDGLQLAVDKGFNRLCIETDSLTALNLISKDCGNHHPLTALILDCRELLSRIPEVTVVKEKSEITVAVAPHKALN
ncbi:hypothetical protein SLEP1_g20489 [Rubroshorea leprosula]|uniref:Reverse transcriptase n=1 Tax=Rubroshorea leprosula TaxID=152421 RepID=A0AAV5J2W5_9ROSI|nr:hypothetical protein SLEP1_g20489 [Rubroshorea leprosula]